MHERKAAVKRKLRERAVPASPMGRIFGFAQLGAGLAYGSVTDSVSRVRCCTSCIEANTAAVMAKLGPCSARLAFLTANKVS